MHRNSTLKLWDHLLKEEYSAFDRSLRKILIDTQQEPKKETINTILAYASSVKGIKTRTNNVLISLN
jgi:hypothetical protein